MQIIAVGYLQDNFPSTPSIYLSIFFFYSFIFFGRLFFLIFGRLIIIIMIFYFLNIYTQNKLFTLLRNKQKKNIAKSLKQNFNQLLLIIVTILGINRITINNTQQSYSVDQIVLKTSFIFITDIYKEHLHKIQYSIHFCRSNNRKTTKVAINTIQHLSHY